MITLEQAQEFLQSVGITAPDFIVQLWVDRVNTIQECLDEHYDPATALLIQLYLIQLMGVVSNGGRYVTSQTAPSGASQSYKYGALIDNYRSTLSMLNSLDPYGCSGPLIPAEPGAKAGMWIGRGGCDCV